MGSWALVVTMAYYMLYALSRYHACMICIYSINYQRDCGKCTASCFARGYDSNAKGGLG